jgi:hypothetical protein
MIGVESFHRMLRLAKLSFYCKNDTYLYESTMPQQKNMEDNYTIFL